MRTYNRYDFEEAGLEQILRLNQGWDIIPLPREKYRFQREGESPYVLLAGISLIYSCMGKLLRVEINGVLQVPGEEDVVFEDIEEAEKVIAARGLPQAWRTIVCLSARNFIRNIA